MRYIFKSYFLNFFIWWYKIKASDIVNLARRILIYAFIYLNIWPMLSHLFVPMFQDRSITGRLVAFPIRLIWGVGGLFVEIVLFVPVTVFVAFYFALPIFLLVAIINFII